MLEELRRLVGAPRRRRVGASVKRLQAAGLLTWTGTTITLIERPRQLTGIDLNAYAVMLKAIPYHQRKVPVPRRTLQFIAAKAPSTRKILVATMFGVMVRCLYYRHKQCQSGGRCKASWIAEVFRVDLAHTKHALADLQHKFNWLIRQPTQHWQDQQHGCWTIVHLEWQAPQATKSGHKPPPQIPNNGHKPPPLDSDSELSSKLANHNNTNSADQPHAPTDPPPPAPASAAVVLQTDETVQNHPGDAHILHSTPSPTPATLPEGHQDSKEGAVSSRGQTSNTPLKDIQVQDLKSYAGIERLFAAFCTQGLPPTDANRLHVHAAAHYACRKAKNAPAYFRSLVDHQTWHWLQDQDYEAARRQVAAAMETMPPPGTPVYELLKAFASNLSMPATSAPPAATQHGHAGQSEAPVVRTYRLFDATAAQQEEQQRLVQWQQELAQQQQFQTAAREALTREGAIPDYCLDMLVKLRALELFTTSTPAREAPPASEADALKETPVDILAIVQPVHEALGQDHAAPHQHRWKDWGTQATWCWCLDCHTHHPDCQCPMCAGESPPSQRRAPR